MAIKKSEPKKAPEAAEPKEEAVKDQEAKVATESVKPTSGDKETSDESKGEAPAATQSVSPAPEEKAPDPENATNPTPEQAVIASQVGGRMVTVINNGKSFLYQPSTGIRIQSKETRQMLDDSWLKLQEDVRLLERA